MSKCIVCSSEMKLIPAGVSKSTGKPYSSFWACPNKCKQFPVPVQQETPERVYAPISEEKKPDWDKIRDEKRLGIHWEVCLKLACEAFIAGKIEKEKIPLMTNWLFEIEPNKKQHPF